MEWMQPRIERAETDHEGDRIGADNARPRCSPNHPLPGRPDDRELEGVDEGENRAEGEIDDDHRAQESADFGRADPNSQQRPGNAIAEQAKREGFDFLSFALIILRSLVGARLGAEQPRLIPQPADRTPGKPQPKG